PFTDLGEEKNRNALLQPLKEVEEDKGTEYPRIIGGERIMTEENIVSVNPEHKHEDVGYVSKADKELAEKAMQNADKNFAWWRKSDPVFRAGILFRAAAIVRRRKHEFTARLIKEGGKPWKEADADVAEGIDFMEYYGREMLRLKD